MERADAALDRASVRAVEAGSLGLVRPGLGISGRELRGHGGSGTRSATTAACCVPRLRRPRSVHRRRVPRTCDALAANGDRHEDVRHHPRHADVNAGTTIERPQLVDSRITTYERTPRNGPAGPGTVPIAAVTIREAPSIRRPKRTTSRVGSRAGIPTSSRGSASRSRGDAARLAARVRARASKLSRTAPVASTRARNSASPLARFIISKRTSRQRSSASSCCEPPLRRTTDRARVRLAYDRKP